jgi:LysR family transcriptional regulator, hydrogen peroxide-inducible genes activator
MRSTPTVAQLRAFVAVAEFQHFRDAAASLGVSQPTLSQSLATMEAKLGVHLIERNPRTVLVTPEGQFLLPLARTAVDAVDAFRTAALPDTWLSGPLHVGMIPTIAPYLLPSLLPAVHAEAPELQLHVHEDQTDRLLEALAEGRIDVAVLALPLKDARIRTEALYDEDFVLAVPADHPWAGATDVSPSQLEVEQLLFLEEGHCLREQAVEVCVSSGVAHAGEANARAASLSTIVQLVSAGLGMTFLPDSAVKVETRGAQLGVARFAEPAPGRTIVLAQRRTSTRAEEFEDFAEIVRRAVESNMPSVRRATAPAA